MHHRKRIRRSLSAMALGATALIVIAACQNGFRITSPRNPGQKVSLTSVPPAVEEATLQPLEEPVGAANARLEVRFERGDRRIARGVELIIDGKAVFLRDDGASGDLRRNDGIHSALLGFDFNRLGKQAAELAQRQRQPRLVFSGRQVVGIEDPLLLRERHARLRELSNVRALVASRLKFNLFDLGSSVAPEDVDPARSLVITDPSIVQDPTRTFNPCTGAGNPDGVWTFKHLVTEMVAGTGVDPADFVEAWLRTWDSNQTVSSGFVAAPRHAILPRVLNNWPRTPAGKLDLNRSPFRLAAIVNRIDLAENLVYGGGSAGEGRFVFGVWSRNQPCDMMPFSVIFEYGIEKNNCIGLRDWARQWVDLSSHPINSPQYRDALEAITEQFVKAGAAPNKPNGSALNQLRTNENALDPLWELREFTINGSSHLLELVTTKQSPDETLNNTAAVRDYINANEPAILNDAHVVPDTFPGGTPYMAATSQASANQLETHFRAPGVTNNDARFHFSLNTCSACHIRETGTRFLHIDPTTMPAGISRFMTGATPNIADSPDLFTVSDPVSGVPRTFNDLDRRRQKLADLAGSDCIRFVLIPPRRLIRELIPPFERELPRIIDPRISGMSDVLRMTH